MRKISLSTFSYLIFFTLCISLVVGFFIGQSKPKDHYAMTATVVAIYDSAAAAAFFAKSPNSAMSASLI